MKLSIITINLNNAEGLRKTMESVVKQTSLEFEYIIIDGGSTDESLKVIQSFTNIPQGIYFEVNDFLQAEEQSDRVYEFHKHNHRITYWVSEPDNGIYHAMNKGILIARGEYCQFLNSGDWLASGQVIDMMLNSLPNCSIFYGNMLKQMGKGKFYRDTGPKGEITMLTFYRGTLNHSTALIKRSLFEKYGLYDESFQIVSDWKWYMIVIGLYNETYKYLDLEITCFDMEGISNKKPNLEQKERRQVMKELIPVKILKDYDDNWSNIERYNRINRYIPIRLLFAFIERLLFKFEKNLNQG